MDRYNVQILSELLPHAVASKVRLFSELLPDQTLVDIPDPMCYPDAHAGVFNLIEQGILRLLAQIQAGE